MKKRQHDEEDEEEDSDDDDDIIYQGRSATMTSQTMERMKTLQSAKERVKYEHDEAQKKLNREYANKATPIIGEMSRLVPHLIDECRHRTADERRAYMRSWSLEQGGHYSFRSNPFYTSISSIQQRSRGRVPTTATTPDKNKRKRSLLDSVRGDGVTQIRVTGIPLIYNLLALHNECFAVRFFDGLGPMELYNVYRTSKKMRDCVVRVLPVCLPRFMHYINHYSKTTAMPHVLDDEQAQCNLLAFNALTERFVRSLATDDDRHDPCRVVPRLLSIAHQFCCHYRPFYDDQLVAVRELGT